MDLLSMSWGYFVAFVTIRPYVLALVVTFMVVATAERGWLRMVIWLVVGTFLGWLSEASSIRTEFPFGMYVYHAAEFSDELWIMGVPLFASLSFASLTYFGHSLAYTLLSPLRKGEWGFERVPNMTLLLSLKMTLLAMLLTSWADFVIDPITHLGNYWWLGQIYHYDPVGFHFDVPLTNYFGWLFTTFVIIFINQRIDGFLMKKGLQHKPAFNLPHRPLWCLAYDIGNYIFILSMSVLLVLNPDVPDDKHTGWILLNTIVLIGMWLVFCVVKVKAAIQRGTEWDQANKA